MANTKKDNLNKLLSDRIVLVKADNGVLLTDNRNGESGTKVYEIFNEDGSVDFDSLAFMFTDIAEYMNIPMVCDISGQEMVHITVPIGEADNLFDYDDDEDEYDD